ncbi:MULTISPECIES: RagB/SusD family nutrient uptake outer membrane protein [Segatella]|uniref:RagB/SusD family nutrient uptake outer membrane protein n=1 Tax=Segatella copri TaxID=165179 RepID=A0AA90ZQA9_9BACT|nr:RagB/SusD family nutrient uptake outer membrane protein [Segatella copri]MCW4083112.1 RagB/SusD family nutrient uptake outer membrane protein [Segatella copri]MQN70439.1 RagB/SusD family nutrient uptake outer membrane protein [Segatella copri]MQN76433.1 RagB/SusD family nutrient uptake outer membrane protein [Segatella copri]MQN83442.1 RagB/SusD family nutrient uptake outer membrane protein [Segatella copri]MQO01079.1 RagB/SusD family nutrient uptake outer membrane protein [Segatella copri]
MKTKKLLYTGCFMAASLLSLTSCGDFLDEDPKGQLNPETFYTIEDDYTAGVNTLYDKVNQTQSWTNPMYPQWQGDDITANPGSNKQACAALDAFDSDGANKGVTEAWTQHYAVIKTANLIIEGSEKFPGDKAKIATALGNAHFWRAYSYYYLVRVFGKLPIITKTNIEQFDAQPSEIEKVYELIVQDLKDAINELPTGYDKEPARLFGVDVWATKQAAQSTLAAVYMSMAGYPLNKGTEYYKLAAELAKDVITNNGTYGFILNPDWKEVYSMGNNYNMETVLGINNDAKGWWDHDSQLSSCCRFEGLGDGGWGDAWGEIAFWKRYPEGPRKNAIYAPKVTFQETITEKIGDKEVKKDKISKAVYWWELDNNGKPVVDAYHPMFTIFTVNADEKGNMLKQPYDYMGINYKGMVNDRRHNLIRYSEVLLWYAESAARAGLSDLTEAKKCLKLVRSRAVTDAENVTLGDGTTVKIDNMSAAQLAEACYIEHGWEVAGNWVSMVTRRSDELRMDELKKNFEYRVANAPIVVAKEGGKEYTAKESVTVKGAWSEDRIYCPYPTTDGEKNPNLKR